MGVFEPFIDPVLLQIALGLFILGVCFLCLKQVADVLERQCRLREIEEQVRVRQAERPPVDRTQ